MIKKKKGETEVNLTNFLRRFAGYDALMKFHEDKGLCQEDDLFPKGGFGFTTPGEETVDEYSLEKAVVENISCNRDQPLCLYDFTIKHVMTDFIAYAVPNLLDFKIDDYHYESDYEGS